MPVTLGSTHVKVKFSPDVVFYLEELSNVSFEYLKDRESGVLNEEKYKSYLPFKVRHYLKYCADRAVILGSRHNYRNVHAYRLPEGTWTAQEGGFSFVTYPESKRAVGIFDESYIWPEDKTPKGTLVLTETQPGKWIASVRGDSNERS